MTFDEAILRVACDPQVRDRMPAQIATLVLADTQTAQISNGDVALLLGCGTQRAFRAIEALVQAGWITRGRATDDRRRVDLQVTDAGREVLARLRAS